MAKKYFILFAIFTSILFTNICCTKDVAPKYIEKPKESTLSSNEFVRGKEGKVKYTYKHLPNKPIDLYYYIPSKGNIEDMEILFSFHGADRGGASQIIIWGEFAELKGFIILAPDYQQEYYDGNEYQFGGVFNGIDFSTLNPREKWTYQTIEDIFSLIKGVTGNKSKKYKMSGHSAGGQFVHRFLLAMPNANVDIAVASNPACWTFLTDGIVDNWGRTHGWPYSVRNSPFNNEHSIKSFLSKRLFVHLGTLDTETSGPGIPTNVESLAQGACRYERGWNFYNSSKLLAKERGYDFNWKIREVNNVGHGGRSVVYGTKKVVNGSSVFSIDNITDTGAYYLLFEENY